MKRGLHVWAGMILCVVAVMWCAVGLCGDSQLKPGDVIIIEPGTPQYFFAGGPSGGSLVYVQLQLDVMAGGAVSRGKVEALSYSNQVILGNAFQVGAIDPNEPNKMAGMVLDLRTKENNQWKSYAKILVSNSGPSKLKMTVLKVAFAKSSD